MVKNESSLSVDSEDDKLNQKRVDKWTKVWGLSSMFLRKSKISSYKNPYEKYAKQVLTSTSKGTIKVKKKTC